MTEAIDRPRQDMAGNGRRGDDSGPLVSIQDVHFALGGKMIFSGIDIEIARGKVTAIMGPSGTGKTTLLQLIAGQRSPDRGTIRVDGLNVHSLSRGKLFDLRKRIGMLFQTGALFTDLSVFDNVAFPLREHTQLPERIIRALVLMKLEAVGLRGARDLMPQQLSGGMKRRVALARAIALDPLMIMYDEPFTGQDPITMGVLVQLIRRLNDALGLTSIVVSHDVQETLAIADDAYVLSGGKVVGHGTPESLAVADSEWVNQFLRGLPDGPVPFNYPASDYLEELMMASPK